MAICSACETAVDTFMDCDYEFKEDFAVTSGVIVWHFVNHTCSNVSGCPCTCTATNGDTDGRSRLALELASPGTYDITITTDNSYGIFTDLL